MTKACKDLASVKSYGEKTRDRLRILEHSSISTTTIVDESKRGRSRTSRSKSAKQKAGNSTLKD